MYLLPHSFCGSGILMLFRWVSDGLALRSKAQSFVAQPLDTPICYSLEASYSSIGKYMRP